jgi:hypothetical protein
MARRIELLLLALVSASALVAPIRRAVPRAALRSTPPESGAGTSTASSDATTEGGDAVPASDAAAAPTLAEDAAAAATDAVAVADADDAAAASTKFRGDANKPKDYEDFNPDQPDIVQKFVKQRDDWWAADSPFPGAPVEKSGDDGPIDSLAKIPVPAYLWLLTSTVGAIAFVGCIFQLFYNVPPAPVLGVPLTAAIGTVSGPAFVLLFLVAIARGQREADEDDAKYM